MNERVSKWASELGEGEREGKKAGAGNLYPEINVRECGIGSIGTVGILLMEKCGISRPNIWVGHPVPMHTQDIDDDNDDDEKKANEQVVVFQPW